jgi:uncharacterized protein YdcH (DUF465 family)
MDINGDSVAAPYAGTTQYREAIAMTVEKHDLIHEFPEHRDRIHTLKTTDHHFARLFEQYHEIDHEVHRIEHGTENTSDDYLEERKKQRLNLKDQLYRMILAA